MITLTYSSESVGPICRRVAAEGADIQVVPDTELNGRIEGTLIRWGSRWRGHADQTINSSEAVNLARDKHQSRLRMGDLAPKTWFGQSQIRTPCVVRPRRHHAGNKFFTCHDDREVRRALVACGKGWYASELVTKKHEYRVFILQGRVLAVSERFPSEPGAVAWNLAVGGRLINCERKAWNMAAVRASIYAASKLGLDWAAVDVAVDEAGKAVVFEANTAPGLRNPYTITQIARAFTWLDYNPAPAAAVIEGAKWKELLHPSLL